MRRKVAGAHAIDWLQNGPVPGQPAPSPLLLWLLRRRIDKLGISDRDLDRFSRLFRFELEWWRCRGWLAARSFRDLAKLSAPGDFDLRRRLLQGSNDAGRLLEAS
ncbi:MAG: hypothetical protein JRI23_03460 [Deltaproteobacteria bacterium]|nr:hypothetical protein [Deltaproteobacteria bacterium]MBW2530568.1 hypothetical protein [Deltaproteobacteria bacterium]